MAGQNADPLPLHRRSKNRLPAEFLAQQVLHRNLAILQGDFRHRRSPQSHLVQLAAHAESRRPFIHQKRGHAIRPAGGIKIRKNNGDVRVRSVAAERLRPVQHIFIALAFRPRLQAIRVRPRSRLGHGVQAQPAAHQSGKIFLFLRLGAEIPDRNLRTPHVRIDRKQQPVVVAPVPESFERTHRRQNIRAAAPVLHRNRQSLNPKVRAFLPQRTGKFLITIARNYVVLQFLTRESDDLLPKCGLLLIPCKVQGVVLLIQSGPGTPDCRIRAFSKPFNKNKAVVIPKSLSS